MKSLTRTVATYMFVYVSFLIVFSLYSAVGIACLEDNYHRMYLLDRNKIGIFVSSMNDIFKDDYEKKSVLDTKNEMYAYYLILFPQLSSALCTLIFGIAGHSGLRIFISLRQSRS